ncbi:MAG TPA: ParB N-terminal domain-containing protein [Anaeromyxobacteraceae bacterium]|nr:ParB N-terminal domain-containing protein [Anaeromyxobacteraceae bacterium]
MGSEIRTTAPAHATGAVVLVPLDQIAPDATFRLRPEGDVAVLAASIGRLGQLEPVELRPLPAAVEGPRFQAVAGFRRLAALRLLLRDGALARVHEELSDEDAWAIALVAGLTGEPLAEAELLALRDRLQASGVAPWALDLVEEARARAPLPPEQRERFYELLAGASPLAPIPASAGAGERATTEGFEVEEVSADDFARELALRMAGLNQDLATAYGAWKDLPEEGRRQVLVQARYVAELLPYLEDAEP